MKLLRRSLLSLAVLAGTVGMSSAALAQANQGSVLRIVPHSNLAILDPIWTTAYMSRNHGYMIYDTLFGTDEKSQIKPQMVESWTESADHRSVDVQAAQRPGIPRW
jgi:peptide/nickel transport system substrate-binding protein